MDKEEWVQLWLLKFGDQLCYRTIGYTHYLWAELGMFLEDDGSVFRDGIREWFSNSQKLFFSANYSFLCKSEGNILIGNNFLEIAREEYFFKITYSDFTSLLDAWEKLIDKKYKEIVIAKKDGKIEATGSYIQNLKKFEIAATYEMKWVAIKVYVDQSDESFKEKIWFYLHKKLAANFGMVTIEQQISYNFFSHSYLYSLEYQKKLLIKEIVDQLNEFDWHYKVIDNPKAPYGFYEMAEWEMDKSNECPLGGIKKIQIFPV